MFLQNPHTRVLASLLALNAACYVHGQHALNFVNLLEPTDDFKCVAIQVGELGSPAKLMSEPLCYEQRLLIQSTPTSGQVEGMPVYIFPVNDEDQSIGTNPIAQQSATIHEDDTRNVWFLHRNSTVNNNVLFRNIDNGEGDQTKGFISFVNFADSPVDLGLRETSESYIPVSSLNYYEDFTQVHDGAFSRSYQYRYVVDAGAQNEMTGFFRVGFREALDLGHTINTAFYGRNDANSFQSITFRATQQNDYVIGPVNYEAALSTEALPEPTKPVNIPPEDQLPEDTTNDPPPANDVPPAAATPPTTTNNDVNGNNEGTDGVITDDDDGIVIFGNEDTDATAGDWCIVLFTGLLYIILIVALGYWTFLLTSTWWELRKRMRGDIGHAKSAKTKILVDVKDEEEEKKKKQKRSKSSREDGNNGDKKKKDFAMKRDRMGSRRMKDALSSMSNGRLFGEEGDNKEEYIKRARRMSKANLTEEIALDMPDDGATTTKLKDSKTDSQV